MSSDRDCPAEADPLVRLAHLPAAPAGSARRSMVTAYDEPPQLHLPVRPLWLCRRCGQPWPCGAAKVALLAEYRHNLVSLFLYLASCLHDAIDDLHRLHPSDTGSTANVFDRFLGWPARHVRSYRLATTTSLDEEEPL